MESFKETGETLISFLKWLLIAMVTGIVLGLIGTLFHEMLEAANNIRNTHSWLLFLLPLSGIVIVGLYHLAGIDEPKGTNLLMDTIHEKGSLPWVMAPLIFVSTILTHLFGGSAGREGAVLQLGGSLASQMGKCLHMDKDDMHMITMCGMSAAFAALFGTPIAAAIFSLEVISVGSMYYSALVPCAISSITASYVSSLMGIPSSAHAISGIPEMKVNSFFAVLILSALVAFLSIFFCFLLHKTAHLFKDHFKNGYLRVITGALIIIALTLVLDGWDYLGAGGNIITNATNGQSKPLAFLMKMVFTAITLGCGFKGGEIVPSFFVGATFGCIVGPCLHLDPSFSAAIGMTAMFAGVTNCPLATLIISIEMFGMQGALFYLLTAAVSYMLSGYHGLYTSQKIIYSKTRTKYIDRNTD